MLEREVLAVDPLVLHVCCSGSCPPPLTQLCSTPLQNLNCHRLPVPNTFYRHIESICTTLHVLPRSHISYKSTYNLVQLRKEAVTHFQLLRHYHFHLYQPRSLQSVRIFHRSRFLLKDHPGAGRPRSLIRSCSQSALERREPHHVSRGKYCSIVTSRRSCTYTSTSWRSPPGLDLCRPAASRRSLWQ
jgi:hypothetical protein